VTSPRQYPAQSAAFHAKRKCSADAARYWSSSKAQPVINLWLVYWLEGERALPSG